MPRLRLALDEDVAHPLAGLLRSRGHGADSAKELGRLGLSDAAVFNASSEAGQTLITRNKKDFRLLHEAWALWRRRWQYEIDRSAEQPPVLSGHPGILVVPDLPYPQLALLLEEMIKFEEVDRLSNRLFTWKEEDGWQEMIV